MNKYVRLLLEALFMMFCVACFFGAILMTAGPTDYDNELEISEYWYQEYAKADAEIARQYSDPEQQQ